MGKDKPFNNPFFDQRRALKKQVRAQHKTALKPPSKPDPEPERPATDADVFMAAMGHVDRAPNDPRGKLQPELPPGDAQHIRVTDDDAEALAELASLIDGTGQFDISDSDEFIEGCAEGVDRRILRKLKAGDYAVHAHLDLHGMTRDPARLAVETFITGARTAGHRCVLIVHGRGLNS